MVANVMHIEGKASGMGLFGPLSLAIAVDENSPTKSVDELTNTQWFQVFEKIDLEYRAKAFLSKPIVAIPLTFAAAMGFVA